MAETEYDSSRIERKKRGLYSATKKDDASRQHSELSRLDIDVANDWGDTEIVKKHEEKKKRANLEGIVKTLVAVAILMIVASGGILLVQYFDPLRKPSDKNIQISFDVPVGVTPGIPADITVHVTNNNRVALEYANLTLVYPSGTRMMSDANKDLHDEKKLFGTIGAGESVEYGTKGIFLGEKNTDKEIEALLEYRFGGINSVFTKKEKRAVHILASPINLVVDVLKEVNAGQIIEFVMDVSSNATIPLHDVIVTMEYPNGFTFDRAEPKPIFGNNTWRVGTLEPGGKFSIKMRGVLSGEDTQRKVFYTSVGVANDRTERGIDVVFGKVLSDIAINRPFIGITLSINNKSSEEAVASYGQNIAGRVDWINNLQSKIVDAQIEVRLKGIALNPSTISAESGGFYDSNKDVIFWDFRGNPQLSVLKASERGSVGFLFRPYPSVSGTTVLTNPEITAEVTVRGKRISETGVPEEIKTVEVKKVRISSEAQFAARIVHFVGPFKNSGPIPPRAEQETTYTVIWSIVNTSNKVSGTQVRATLPVYVSWTGSVSPQNENIRYDRNTYEVTWNAGDISAGTGVGGTPPREVAFQVTFLPSRSQIGNPPVLIKGTVFSATDSFTGDTFYSNKGDLHSNLTTDPLAPKDNGEVVP